MQADSLLAEPQGKPKNTGAGSLSLLQRIFRNQEYELRSPALQADSLASELSRKPITFSEKVIFHSRPKHRSQRVFVAGQRKWYQRCCIHIQCLALLLKVAQLCRILCDPMDDRVHGILQARILEWVTFPLLQGIFPTQGLNPGLPHCRRILYQLCYKGSPRILEWVAYPFFCGSS